MMQKIDYSSLSQPISKEDLKKVSSKIGTSWLKIISWLTVGVIFFGYVLGLVLGAMTRSGGGFRPTVPTFLFFGLIAAILSIVYFIDRRRVKYLARASRFAEQNGLVFRFNIQPVGMNGLMFDKGHTRVIKEALSFPDGLELGRFEYVTGSGKNRSTHTVNYVKVALSRHLPNMVLDATSNNLWKFSNLPGSFDRSQRLALEGNFDKYFELYVPKKYERDALYVFTPDVMQALIAHGRDFDIEVVNDELYFYSQTQIDLTSESSLKHVLNIVDTISTELRQQSRRYSDERVAGNKSGSVVSTPGQKLRQGLSPILVVGIIIALIHFLLQFIPAILDTM